MLYIMFHHLIKFVLSIGIADEQIWKTAIELAIRNGDLIKNCKLNCNLYNTQKVEDVT